MTKVTKRYIIGAQAESNGLISYYINIDEDFIKPILKKKISIFRGQSVKVSDVVGTMQTFSPAVLGEIIDQIEQHIRDAGLR